MPTTPMTTPMKVMTATMITPIMRPGMAMAIITATGITTILRRATWGAPSPSASD
jgi:hypothetical protein